MKMFQRHKYRKALRSFACLVLALVLVWEPLGSAVGAMDFTQERDTAQPQAEVFCKVKYSKPAICCDVGQKVDLSRCGVQFAPEEGMVTQDLRWSYEGRTVKSFTPEERGVYPLTVKAQGQTATVYVVAKSQSETEYVLYRNDFDEAPTDFRQGNNASVVDGSYSLPSGEQVLLPEFLDAFGDATVKASVKTADGAAGWLLFRTQPGGTAGYEVGLSEQTVELLENRVSRSQTAFADALVEDYNLYTLTAKGTYCSFSVNSRELVEYANTAYARGAYGFRADGAALEVDYVQVSLEGNDPIYTTCDVSFAKPVLRADMGDTLDLQSCDVQFQADTLYVEGKGITWKQEGQVITTFTPSQPGVTELTAYWANREKRIYVVTRSLEDGEYVLYQNDFNAPTQDLRPVGRSGAAYYDGKGHYVLDASASAESHVRVLLPEFLDDFQNFKLEAGYQQKKVQSQTSQAALSVNVDDEEIGQIVLSGQGTTGVQPRSGSAVSDSYDVYTLTVQNNQLTGQINEETVLSQEEHPEIAGGMGLQALGVMLTVDYVRVTLGATTAVMDTAVRCTVSRSRPAIGCNVGQTVLLSQCPVQFTYGSYVVPGDQITWRKDGKVITEYSNTTKGIHTLTATHGHTTLTIYVVVKNSTASEYVLYSTVYDSSPLDYRVAEASGGAKVYPISGAFVLDGSAGNDAYARVLLPVLLDQFGDLNLEASILMTNPVDFGKWGSVVYRAQSTSYPYMQCCMRYDPTVSNGIEIAQRTINNTWNVLHEAKTGAYKVGQYNVINVITSNLHTTLKINNTVVLQGSDTPYSVGSWGFQVRGVKMTVDYVRVFFTENYTSANLYALPGGYVDVRDPATGITNAPSMVSEVKTRADFDNILTDCPAVAIMSYEVDNGVGKIVFSDGTITPDQALNWIGSKIIPAFRVGDEAAVDSLASFLKGRSQRDVYVVSSNPSLLKRAYTRWQYLRGVADYSDMSNFDAETLRYNAWEHKARVLILPESASKTQISHIQDSYSCVWLKVSEGKTATVAGTNKGPYGLVTPNRSVTESCYKNYYGTNTLVRKTNIIGHRGNLSLAPENTILGTKTAYNNGADMVENDIYLTSDGVVVVMHDETLDRTTNGTGKVVDKTLAQIRKYSVDYYSGVAAQPIPTLEDYFSLIKGNSSQKLVIEMKHPYDSRLANATVNLINKYDILDQVVLMSFITNNIANVTSVLPGAPVGLLSWIEFNEEDPMYSTYAAIENVQPYHSVCNPGYNGWGAGVIKEIANRGVTLWPWTVNDRGKFDKLFIGGVAGITTDYPQWCKSYIESLHWNSNSRVISSTYNGVLTDVTNSCEVVVIEDTLGLTCSAGNITVPKPAEGGKATLYYRYKHTTASGQTYYTVTEIRTIVIPTTHTFTLKSGSGLSLSGGMLTKLTDSYTVATLKDKFEYPVEVLDTAGYLMSDTARVGTGCVVRLKADPSQKATVLMLGDVNGDGAVNATDYVRIKNYLLGDLVLDTYSRKAADCNQDGTIDLTDYMIIRYHALRLTNLFKH